MSQKHFQTLSNAAGVLLLLLFSKFVHGADFPPVYWLEGNETVIAGQYSANILIKLRSPCEWSSREWYTIFKQVNCETLYDGALLLQLKSLCEATTVKQRTETEETEEVEIASDFQPDVLAKMISDSDLMEKFNHYRQLILKQQRSKDAVNEEFLKMFGIKPSSHFPGLSLTNSENFECSLENGTQLNLRFTLNKAKTHLKLLHAKAFYFLEAFDDKRCQVMYNGTQNVIWSKEKNCVTSLNFERLRPNLVNVTGDYDECLETSPVQGDKPYFNVSCELEMGVDKPEIKFAQGFRHGDTVHVSCKGTTMQMRGAKWSCPSQPFSVGATEQLSIDGFNDTQWNVTSALDDASILSDKHILTVNLMVNPEELNVTERVASYLASPDANIYVIYW